MPVDVVAIILIILIAFVPIYGIYLLFMRRWEKAQPKFAQVRSGRAPKSNLTGRRRDVAIVAWIWVAASVSVVAFVLGMRVLDEMAVPEPTPSRDVCAETRPRENPDGSNQDVLDAWARECNIEEGP